MNGEWPWKTKAIPHPVKELGFAEDYKGWPYLICSVKSRPSSLNSMLLMALIESRRKDDECDLGLLKQQLHCPKNGSILCWQYSIALSVTCCMMHHMLAMCNDFGDSDYQPFAQWNQVSLFQKSSWLKECEFSLNTMLLRFWILDQAFVPWLSFHLQAEMLWTVIQCGAADYERCRRPKFVKLI